MDLSIVIVNYNAGKHLVGCLESLSRHLANVSHEICVVDNASSDGNLEMLRTRFREVKLLANSINRGFAAALNQGLRETAGTFVLWLNPDAELLDDGFQTLLEFLEKNPSVGVLGPQLVNPDGSRQLSCRSFPSYQTALFHRYSVLTRLFPNNRYSRQYLHSDWAPDGIQETDWVSGACLLHRRSVLEKLGGLDEQFFMYCEDVDFCLRTRRAGWSVRYHPGARVLHRIGASSRQVAGRMIVERHRSMWRYYAKNFHRNPVMDMLVGLGIASRCGFLLIGESLGRLCLRKR